MVPFRQLCTCVFEPWPRRCATQRYNPFDMALLPVLVDLAAAAQRQQDEEEAQRRAARGEQGVTRWGPCSALCDAACDRSRQLLMAASERQRNLRVGAWACNVQAHGGVVLRREVLAAPLGAVGPCSGVLHPCARSVVHSQ